jgi:hypothetical protein
MLKQLDILIGLVTVMTVVSLLITVINQMIMSGFQYRGKRLLDALEVMFKTLKPDLADRAKALAEAVLRHPIISDSAKRGKNRALASAIRPQELLDILHNLAKSTPAAAGAPPTRTWIGNTNAELEHAGPQTNLVAAAAEVLALLRNPDAIDAANNAMDAAANAVPEAQRDAFRAHAATLVQSATAGVNSALQHTEKWFSTVEDRAREWFATNAQKWNVLIAIVLTFLLQLDALHLYRQLAADDAYRAKLVAIAGDVGAKSHEATEHTGKLAEAIHKAAIESLKKGNGLDAATLAKLDKRPPNVVTKQQERDWIASHVDAAAVDGVVKKYGDAFATAAGAEFDTSQKALEEVVKTAKSLDKEIANSGFQIIPANYPGSAGEWLGVTAESSDGKIVCDFRHLLGMAIFAALLSLGAPYWFNILKTLTSFRPLLSQEVDKDQKKKNDGKTKL